MELLLLSIALAMDAAALSIANGAKYRNLALSKILFIAFVFGFFQAAMPLAGYFLGAAFARFIAQIDHFIAFAILGFLGAVCFALSVAAFYVGKFAGEFLEQKALILGGAILIALGFKILITHLLDHGFLS